MVLLKLIEHRHHTKRRTHRPSHLSVRPTHHACVVSHFQFHVSTQLWKCDSFMLSCPGNVAVAVLQEQPIQHGIVRSVQVVEASTYIRVHLPASDAGILVVVPACKGGCCVEFVAAAPTKKRSYIRQRFCKLFKVLFAEHHMNVASGKVPQPYLKLIDVQPADNDALLTEHT